MRKSLCSALVASTLIVLLAVPRQALAWGAPGHMAVAYIAWQKLGEVPGLQDKVTALLKRNKYYQSHWATFIPAGTPQDEADMYMFMMAATWPDELRGDNSYSGTDAVSSDPTPARNTGYDDLERHLYWHFVDQNLSPDHTAPTTLQTPNAATQIKVFRAELSSPDASDDLKSYDLIWIEHLVGDIHQPLHCADRWVGGKDDRGGNGVHLVGDGGKLHSYWDDIPGHGQTPNYAIAVNYVLHSALPVPPTSQVNDTNVDNWAKDSFNLAQKDAYASPPIKLPPASSTLTPAYRTTADNDAKRQISLAGARLAKLIIDNLK